VDFTLRDQFQLSDREAYHSLIRERPEWYDHEPEGRKLRVFGDLALFMNQSRQTVEEIYFTLLKEEVDVVQPESPPTLKRGIYVFDPQWQERYQDIQIHPTFLEYEDALIGWHQMPLISKRGMVIVEFYDEATGSAGRWSKILNLKTFPPYNLSVSHLVWAWSLDSHPGKTGIKRGGINLIPNTFRTYLLSSQPKLYFEVNNLAFGPDGQTHFQVEMIVEPEPKERRSGLDRWIHRLFGKDPSVGRVQTAYEYQGLNRQESLFQTLVLEKPFPEEYRFQVRITDFHTGEEVLTEKRFRLVQSETNR
jgi:hypothetical protein